MRRGCDRISEIGIVAQAVALAIDICKVDVGPIVETFIARVGIRKRLGESELLDLDAFGLRVRPYEFFDEVRQDGAEPSVPGFWKLPTGFDRLLANWSTCGPVAYVEADYFGGVGTQVAAVWDGGQLVLGPVVESVRPLAPQDPSPISRALRRLGVSARGQFDEFEAAGLGRHRQMEDWLEGAL